jgi:hypothetical protein
MGGLGQNEDLMFLFHVTGKRHFWCCFGVAGENRPDFMVLYEYGDSNVALISISISIWNLETLI